MPTLSTRRAYVAQALHCTKVRLPACFRVLYFLAELVVSLRLDNSACSAITFPLNDRVISPKLSFRTLGCRRRALTPCHQ